jgi:hypothetical protein
MGDVRNHRRMADSSLCSICGENDSWRHSLINCPIARFVWALADEGVTEHMCANEDPSPKQWLFAMMETLPRDDFARVAVTLWAIWFARRKIVHEEVYKSPLSTHLFIENYLRDLSLTVKSQTLGKGGSKHNHLKWIPPRAGYVKINVDAVIEKVEVGGMVGAVCRAEDGTFLGVSVLKIRGDEGMMSGPSIFTYLVFSPEGTSAEGIARPMKLAIWRNPGARLGVQCKTQRRRPSRIRTRLGFIQTDSICNWLGEQSRDPTFAYKRLGGRS